MGKAKIYDITATGSTTPRDIRDRFADVVNVKDFGAKGDGVLSNGTYHGTDDHNAFQEAINFAISTGKSVYIPAGNYCISNALRFPSVNAMRVFGDGTRTTLVLTVAHHFFYVTSCSNVHFDNFNVYVNEGISSGNVFQIENSNDCMIEHVDIDGAGNDAVCIVDSDFENFAQASPRSLRNSVKNCNIKNSRSGAGIRVLFSQYTHIQGCNIQGNHHEAVCYDYGSYNSITIGNDFRSNGGAGQISLDGGSNSVISGNIIRSTPKTGIPCITANGNLETTYTVAIVGNVLNGGENGIWLKGFSASSTPDPEEETNYYGANRCLVTGNIFRDAACGIRLDYRSTDNTILGNSYVECDRHIKNFARDAYNWILPESVGVREMANMGYPTSTKINLTPIPASGTEVESSVDGWVEFFYNSSGGKEGWRGCANKTIQFRNTEFRFASQDASKYYLIPIKKGELFSVTYPNGTSGHTIVLFSNDGQRHQNIFVEE